MRSLSSIIAVLHLLTHSIASPTAISSQQRLQLTPYASQSRNISSSLFADLEELARIVDITYCVGTTGIQTPFLCASRCSDFPNFELLQAWDTGPLLSDSCGYVAVDHGPKRRIVVAFRGTYSLANTIVDLSTVPQEYVPYPDNPDDGSNPNALGWLWEFIGPVLGIFKSQLKMIKDARTANEQAQKCENCTVHSGFFMSWLHTRDIILPSLKEAKKRYPECSLHLVGHSLGGAVAALAALEFETLGWAPTITTFGEPRVGNSELTHFIDSRFGLLEKSTESSAGDGGRYRRVTHIDDPVPLLPLKEWGYEMHAGEVYIEKPTLTPAISDIHHCVGDEDEACIAGTEVGLTEFGKLNEEYDFVAGAHSKARRAYISDDSIGTDTEGKWEESTGIGVALSHRYKIWQLFFAHRDYFWRLGLCVPGGDPANWGHEYNNFNEMMGYELKKKAEV